MDRRSGVRPATADLQSSGPPYSPELNPQETLWDEIREKRLKSSAIKSIDEVYAKLGDKKGMSETGWSMRLWTLPDGYPVLIRVFSGVSHSTASIIIRRPVRPGRAHRSRGHAASRQRALTLRGK
jgi:hypothetical protein